jgi:hypothetical protein
VIRSIRELSRRKKEEEGGEGEGEGRREIE